MRVGCVGFDPSVNPKEYSGVVRRQLLPTTLIKASLVPVAGTLDCYLE